MAISGGLSSRIYLVENVVATIGQHDVFKFLVRLYGGRLMTDDEPAKTLSPTEEALIYQAADLAGLGPKLYGVFDGGRVEEFVASHQLRETDLKDTQLLLEVARKLARFHALRVPMSKKPRDTLKIVEIYMSQYVRERFLKFIDLVNNGDASFMTEFDYESEIVWLRRMVPKIGGRLVTLHGDLHKNNILVRDQVDSFNERIMLIDFELAGTEYRGRDIGTFFVSHIMEINDDCMDNNGKYPDNDRQRAFITEYLRQTQKLANFELDEQGIDSVDHVMMEANFYVFVTILSILGVGMKQDESSFLLQLPKEVGHGWMVSEMSKRFLKY